MAQRLPQTSRAATVRSLGKAVRAYVESPMFRQVWLQNLRSDYPYDEAYSEDGLTRRKQAQEAEQSIMQSQVSAQLMAMNQTFAQLEPIMLKIAVQTQITQEEEELASMTGNERVTRAQLVATLKQIMTLPPTEFKKQYLASLKQQLQAKVSQSDPAPVLNKERLTQEHQQKANFDAHADFRPLLKKRLQNFISLSESIDFEARLVPMGRKQIFANPVYEHKCAEWKFLYRLGKEPVDEARLFAKQWLTELR